MYKRSAFLHIWQLVLWAMLTHSTVVFATTENTVKDLRIWQGPDSSRMVFDLSKSISPRIFMLSNPERIVIDLPSTAFNAALDTTLKPPISHIRHGRADNNLTRLVVELTNQSKVSSFLLEPQKHYGYRLVVDVFPSEQQAHASLPKQTDSRNILIAVDAGHGGEDYGAIADAVNEKSLVLEYAKTIVQEIRAHQGFNAFLVRDGDYFIPLQKRMQIAREKHADMFLSIHANSFPADNKVSGFMVFALSERGASSSTARWLAESENNSNAIGGVNRFLDVEVANERLRKVILDLSVTSVLNHSLLAGRQVLRHVAEVTRLHKKTIETANFVVLRAPDTPALLIELGFLSNPKEIKTMMQQDHRLRVSHAIANGIKNYFYDYPPHGAQIATLRNEKISDPWYYHTVQKGETLSQIALHTGVSVSQLTKINGLEDHQILVGQKLRLREQQEKQPQKEPEKQIVANSHYQVQSGDTLWEIARKYNMSVAELRSINNLSAKQSIQPGQKLRLHND